MRADLLQARLDAGYALLHLAGTQSGREVRRALREARAACREGEQRLKELREPGLRHFVLCFAKLRRAIEKTATAGGAPARPPARVLQMPARH